jgi:hypothetical protein
VLGRLRWGGLHGGASHCAQALERVQVERVPIGQLEGVAGRARAEDRGRQRLAQVRDVDLDHLRRAVRRLVAPQGIEQRLDRDDAPGIEEEAREERALLAAPEDGWPSLDADLERPQDAELRRRSPTLPNVGTRANRGPLRPRKLEAAGAAVHLPVRRL